MKSVNFNKCQEWIREYEPCIKVEVAGYYLTLQNEDEVSVETYPCELCGSHTNVKVYRKGLNANKKLDMTLVFEKES